MIIKTTVAQQTAMIYYRAGKLIEAARNPEPYDGPDEAERAALWAALAEREKREADARARRLFI